MTTILVVDPNTQDREQLSSALVDLGYQVIVASQAAETMLWLDRGHIDLVMLDDTVKDLTPDRLLAELQDRDLETFLIIISRETHLDRGMSWIASGAFAYLGKPINHGHLKDIINKGLENKEAYRQVVAMAQELKLTNRALTREKASLKEKTDELRFLYELGLQLSTTLDGQAVVKIVADTLNQLTGANLVMFLTTFGPPGDVRLYPDRHLVPELAMTLTRDLLPELGLGPEVLNSLRILGPEDGPRTMARRPRHRLMLPLMVAGKSLGVLGLFFFNPPQIAAERNLILKSVALQSAQALYNSFQHESALNMAAHDALTGLFNRRTFDENLAREFERFQRYGADLSLLILDLDHFKSVNDRYGHKSGDEVLKNVAEIIRTSVRNTDIPARIGGEEFAVILPATDQVKAYKLARRIEGRLRRTVIQLGMVEHRQTASQGLAEARDKVVHTPDDLVRLADQALYLAKAKGRNTIRRAVDLGLVDMGHEEVYAYRR